MQLTILWGQKNPGYKVLDPETSLNSTDSNKAGIENNKPLT